MKKKLNIIVLLSLVVLTLFTFGCKKDAELGELEDTAKWNNMQSLGGGSQNKLVIRADDYDIDWWVLTDMKGIVFEDYTSTSSEKSIPKGSEVTLTFDVDKNTNLLLWIAQDGRVPKTKGSDGSALSAGSKDFRGKVIVSPSQGYKVSDSGYREEVKPVGVINLQCNETGSDDIEVGDTKKINGVDCYGGNFSGDYEITEIWPLEQSGAAWQPIDELIFYLEGDDIVKEGESIRVIYPAGKSVFALKQPSRFTESDKEERKEKYNEQKNWYWCLRFEEGNTVDGYFGEIKAHDNNKVTSHDCEWHFDIKEGTFAKSALGTTYIINDSDIVDGSSEK